MGFLQPHGRYRRGDGEEAVAFWLHGSRRAPKSALLAMREKPHPEEPSGARRLEGWAAREVQMSKTFRTLDDVAVKGKRVLLRVDLNVPTENGRVTDLTRLERVAPTITEISTKGGKVILLAHFGRPKGRDPKESLKPAAAALAGVINKPVAFADDCVGDVARD